ncbi:hypothetical protein HPT25_03560 [Bacillus sp. BRMEA1]|uniref:hypothetical protein n=1 Tax=Neobacillus endophyticus TaxID=2738405 RepID=UPI0015649E0C|nr:hypothetical protein [Neobacillus endophyticus]NRD76567.1 hypothetical protein [Neobacillus endophyticus]
MKNILLLSAVLLLCLSLFGCSLNKGNHVSANNQSANSKKINELSLGSAVKKAIDKYNSTETDTTDIKFPTTLKSGDTISKTIQIGGKKGNTTKLDMSIRAEKEGNNYIVTLSKNYNITVNGTKAMSSWKYEITNDSINLLDKKEDGKLINDIK